MTDHENKRLEFSKTLVETFKQSEIHPSVLIGKNCAINNNGFGWIRNDSGTLVPMPHKGNTIIEEHVVIGNNVCIDRAVIGSTVIGAGSKIDNLVHVAHGAKIGKNVLIVAGAVIGGSAEVGDNSYIGMGALIKNKIKIGKNVIIGMGAVVLKDVPDDEIWCGNPAKFLKRNI